MATQRLTIATLAGDASEAAIALFEAWRQAAQVDRASVDHFCRSIRANGHQLPIVFFCEWMDYWLMGDQVLGPESIEGKQYQVAIFNREQALRWSERCGNQCQEQLWLAAMLREAACAWQELVGPAIIIVIREPLRGSTLDEEVVASLNVVPGWLVQIADKKPEENK